MSGFQWTKKRTSAALLLAEGHTIEEVANSVGVNERSIYRWKGDIEFVQEVDRLTHMVGIANRAERLRMAMRIVRQLSGKLKPTQKDLLEWLKYAQSETDGIKLDLTPLFDATTSVAGSGQEGVDREQDPETDDD
jgi:transposase-like protein